MIKLFNKIKKLEKSFSHASQGCEYRFWHGGGNGPPPKGGGPKGGDKGPMGGDWRVIRDKINGTKKVV